MKIGFGVDDLEALLARVSAESRASRLRQLLAIQVPRAIPFEEAWKNAQRVLQGDHGDGDWYETWRFARPHFESAYNRALAARAAADRPARRRVAA